MLVETRRLADCVVVEVRRARLDASVAADVKAALIEVAEAAEGPIVVDLSQVTFIDSSGLGALVGVLRRLGSGDRLELAGINRPVRRVLDLTRMSGVFRLRDAAPVR